jgi:putative membrane protein
MAAVFPQILIGAYISLSKTDLYPIYILCGRAFGGISPMLDQHLGGLITWIPAGMMNVLVAVIAFWCWIKLDTRGRLPRNRRQRELIRARDAAAARVQSVGPDELAGSTEKLV